MGHMRPIDFSAQTHDGEQRFTPVKEQTNLAQFDRENARRDRMEELRAQRAKARKKGKK